MFKIGIIGAFNFNGKDVGGGNVIKTRNITEALISIYGKDDIYSVDTIYLKKNFFRIFSEFLKVAKYCNNIILLPGQKGIFLFIPFFILINKIFHKKIHYIVIGGWLPDLLKKKKWLCNFMKQLDGIFVETKTMLCSMNKLGFSNVYYMPNFKKLLILNKEDLVYEENIPFKLCTFSRVMKEKGIEDAINAVKKINKKNNSVIFSLDIYGFIDEKYKNDFLKMQLKFPNYIKYNGIVDFNKSVEVIKNYYVLLFPTRYKTEGVPGTIIDSYFAGVPVLASKWKNFIDVIDEGKTGIGFKLGNYNDFINKLEWIAKNEVVLKKMKINCLKKSKEYNHEIVMNEFIKHIV